MADWSTQQQPSNSKPLNTLVIQLSSPCKLGQSFNNLQPEMSLHGVQILTGITIGKLRKHFFTLNMPKTNFFNSINKHSVINNTTILFSYIQSTFSNPFYPLEIQPAIIYH